MVKKAGTTQSSHLGHLLHLFDPTLPIGGFSHSSGLETYVQKGIVHNEQTAEAFVRNMLENNLVYNDATFVNLAWSAASNHNIEALRDLDQECSALKAPVQIKEAGRKLGVRLTKIFERYNDHPLSNDFLRRIRMGETPGQYPVVFGLYSSILGLPQTEAIYTFCFNAAVGMVTNAVKLVPLGQMAGQDILFRMHDVVSDVTKKVISLPRELVGVCNIGFDIRCMQHEQLYTRLYMS